MVRGVAIVLSFVIVALFAAPFIRDAVAWYHIRSSYEMSNSERAAYSTWMGTPDSFAQMLRGHCMEAHPEAPQSCPQYHAI
jgi:hypothetical protein